MKTDLIKIKKSLGDLAAIFFCISFGFFFFTSTFFNFFVTSQDYWYYREQREQAFFLISLFFVLGAIAIMAWLVLFVITKVNNEKKNDKTLNDREIECIQKFLRKDFEEYKMNKSSFLISNESDKFPFIRLVYTNIIRVLDDTSGGLNLVVPEVKLGVFKKWLKKNGYKAKVFDIKDKREYGYGEIYLTSFN